MSTIITATEITVRYGECAILDSPVLQRLRDRLGHLDLRGTLFVGRMRPSDRALRREQLSHQARQGLRLALPGGAGGLLDLGHQARQMCQPKRTGIFALVTQLSPTGGANFEDLALVDESGNGQALLIVLARSGWDDDLVMYRRFEHGE